MAGAGYKLFNTGDVLTAAQVNTYLQEQAVMVFASAAARTTALTGVLAEGMMSYLQDTNAVEVYDGSAWVSVGSTGDITGVTAGTGISGGGTSGTVTITNSMATAIDAKGDLIVGTGADTFSRLAVGGTNGHVLTVDSAESTGVKWAAAGGGDFTFISKTSVSAVSTANFNNLFSSTYDNYLIVISNLTGSTNNELHWRMRSSTTNATSSYYLAATGLGSGGSANNMSESNANEMRIAPPPTANDYLTAYVWVSNPNLATYTTINFSAWGDNGSVFVARNGAGNHRQNTSYDGISFGLYGGGNITCDVTCYGIKKS